MMRPLELALKDFFSFRFLMFSLLPLCISFLIFVLIVSSVVGVILHTPIHEENFQFFLGTVVFYLLNVFLYLSGGIFGLFSLIHGWQISIIFALFITSFLTPFITNCINAKHYNYTRAKGPSFGRILLRQLAFFLKFLAFFLACSLLYLVPGVNLFAPLMLSAVFFYLYFNFLITDVASNILNNDDFWRFRAYQPHYLGCVFVYYLLCNIPYVGFFLQVFFIIHLTHTIYARELQIPLRLSLNNH